MERIPKKHYQNVMWYTELDKLSGINKELGKFSQYFLCSHKVDLGVITIMQKQEKEEVLFI